MTLPRRRRPDETVEEYNAVMKDPETGKWNLPPMGSFGPFGFPRLEHPYYADNPERLAKAQASQERIRKLALAEKSASAGPGWYSNLFPNRNQDSGSGLQTVFGSSGLTEGERTNLDAPQTGLSAAQINLRPGLRNITGRQNISNLRTNNPAEVAGRGNLVSDPGGSMYGTDSSSAIADYMLPQEDMTSTLNWSTELQEKYPWIGKNRPPRPFSLEEQNSIETMLERFKADKEANEQRAAYAEEHDVPFKDYIGLPSNFRAENPNQNIPGNIYAKHGGSVFKTAYDQASNIMYRAEGGKAMSGGLSNLRESIDINGQPHKLAYINPDEASLLKAMGGSGRKVNGVPAYFWGGMGEGDWGEGDTASSAGNTETAGGNVGSDAGWDTDFDYGGYYADQAAQAASQTAGGEPGHKEGMGYSVPSGLTTYLTTDEENKGLVENWDRMGTWVAQNTKDMNQVVEAFGKDVVQELINAGKLSHLGVTKSNALEELGLNTFGKAMRGPLEAWSTGKALSRDAYNPGLMTGASPESWDTLEGRFRSYITQTNPGTKTISDVATQFENDFGLEKGQAPTEAFGYSRDSTASIAAVSDALDDAGLAGAFQGLGMFASALTSPISFINSIGKEYGTSKDGKVNETSPLGNIIDSVTDKIGVKDTVDNIKDSSLFQVAKAVNNPVGAVLGALNKPNTDFTTVPDNPLEGLKSIDIQEEEEEDPYASLSEQEGMAHSLPSNLSEKETESFNSFLNNTDLQELGWYKIRERIKKKPIVYETLTEEEEEEKKSIADMVNLEGNLVERLSLQNLRDLLQGIYGPNYEPFGEEA